MLVSLPRLLTFVFLILAWILPYAVTLHTYPIPTFYAEYSALALYLLAGASVFAWVFASGERAAIGAPRVALVPLLFGALLFAQPFIMDTVQPSMNLLGGGFLLAALIATQTGYWISRLGSMQRVFNVMAYALLAGGVFAVFCQFVQLFHLENRVAPFVVSYNVQIGRRPFGNMAQANHLATYIAFALAAALYLVQQRRLRYPVWIVLSVVYTAGQALTVSRGPWLQTGVIVLAGAWMAFDAHRNRVKSYGGRYNTRRSLRDWVTPVLLLVIFVAVNIATRWANASFGLNLGQSAAERFQDASQIAPRLALWKYGLAMFEMHPWFGVGWGEFPRIQYELVDKLGSVEIANNSHNIGIDLLAKTGALGLAIVVVGLLLWFVRVLRGGERIERVFGVALLGIVLMHALVEYPQQYMFFLLPTWLVIGLLETAPLRAAPAAAARAVQGALVLAGLVALYPIQRDYARSEVLYYGSNPYEQYRADPAVLFSAWGEYGFATLLPLDKTDLDKKLAMHRQAMALLPGETVVRRYAVLQAIAGDTDGALQTMRRLKMFADMLKDWPMQLAAVYRACDDAGSVLASFKQALVARYGIVPAAQEADEDSGE
ncbi:O-antigen ligase C-terminal domain-containing protein [Mycetohabitans sp. B8]|uniref:PglL family O-oligosaccharyltransferase n=1 Tax=Mycetohabitans sp. B8 TaxID=2841845 RepID=UPI001F2C46BF|nr:Wzy polymerase domain-containing protein [Mycetohabitans sp. B8]MCG1043222.1 O-antigen ligase C-terminal domain-containing protein [Mycetohabitans sp. B8]